MTTHIGAHLRELTRVCSDCRVRKAVVELYSRENSSYGEFCRMCGRNHLRVLVAYEKANPRQVS